MSISGKTLGHYKIGDQPLGRGGMGEVYRAKDLKLGREVAIKVLPEEFARDPERVGRFQREAKLLASLNHPNIAAIYGLEEFDGVQFLILELVEGETLADRLKRGPIPIEESLKLALQIAEALEAAHEEGVIHRDFKTGNTMVTPGGKVKVLDFGLGKAFAGEQRDQTLTYSPTLSEVATQQGIILGTAAYMSPEQAKGKTIDKRTDVWAFGVVLYELLTGRQLFAAETVLDTLAAVLTKEPDWEKVPARVRFLLRRCLQKDPNKRLRDIADVKIELEEILANPNDVLVQPVIAGGPRPKLRMMFPWIAAAVILGAILAGLAVWNLKLPEPSQVVSFYQELPKDHEFGSLDERAFAVSPDGTRLVYKTDRGLYLRSIAELNAWLIPGTEEKPQKPFFSPDGQWIGYVSEVEGKLKKISINGGASVPLTADSSQGFLSWGKDDTIAYASGGSIMRISANGGDPELVVKTKESACFSPQILPDGKTVMYTPGSSPFKIVVQSLESGEPKELLAGDTAQYLPTGHIVYAVDNALYAVAFDINALKAIGGQIPLVDGVLRSRGAPQYAISDSGTLAYMPGITGSPSPTQRILVWVDRKGKEEPLATPPNDYRNPHISPDGTKVALTVVSGANQNIWIWDLVRKSPTKLTLDDAVNNNPLWTLDSQRIFFRSTRKEGIYWKSADGSGNVEWLFSVPDRISAPASWSHNGKTLLLQLGRDNFDIGAISMEGGHEWKPLLQEKYIELQPQISPDGRWMAYMSNESGQYQIYVRPFPDVSVGRYLVSRDGGDSPLWSPDGRELLYRSGDSVVAVTVELDPIFKVGKSEILFRRNYVGLTIADGRPWDIHPKDKRFLMLKEGRSAFETTAMEIPRKINMVLNWFEELKQRVPVK